MPVLNTSCLSQSTWLIILLLWSKCISEASSRSQKYQSIFLLLKAIFMCLEAFHCSGNEVVLCCCCEACVCCSKEAYRTVCLLGICSSMWFTRDAVITQCLNKYNLHYICCKVLSLPACSLCSNLLCPLNHN